jgi:hypothetical protein
MTDRDDLLRRVTTANPVPSDVDLPDEFSDSRPPVGLLIEDRPPTDTRSMYAGTRWWRGPVIAVAAALVILVAISIPLLLGGGQEGTQTANTTPTMNPATTTAPPLPTTTAPLAPRATDESWQQVGAGTTRTVVGLRAIARVGSRLIAAGFDPGNDLRQDGVIFASEDGVTWTRLAKDDPALTTGTVLIYGITAGGPGLVAAGTSCDDNTFPCESGSHPTVWSSIDGAAWTRTVVDPSTQGGAIQDVVKTASGIVAASWIQGLGTDDIAWSRLEMWRSEDGVAWSRRWTGDSVPTGDSPLPGEVVGALVAAPDGLIVGVGSALNADGHRDPAVWTSPDGDSWERIDLSSSATSGSGLDVVMFDVAWGPAGYVAVGSEFGGTSGPEVAIWRSSDARLWTRIATTGQPFGATGSLSSVAALASGYMAAGPEGFGLGEGPVTLWTSPDGATWDRVLTLDAGSAQAIVAIDSRAAIAGQVIENGGTDADDFHAAIWMGPVFDPDAPPPDPVAPTVGGDSREGRAGIGTLSGGFACEELALANYSYPEVVTYWMRYDTYVDLDPDGNGMPCEADYPASEIADVYGGLDAVPVHIVSDLPDAMAFVATGPAVDAGIVCPGGTIEFTGYVPTPIHDGSFTRWENRYTCSDGSGTFILGADVFFDVPENRGIWSIVSGTGAYETLRGGGGSITAPTVGPTDSDTWSDDLVGRLRIETEDN